MSFLVATMGIGSMMILPFYLWEVAEGGRIEGGLPAWLALAYIAVFPSFVAYLFFNRGIELIGAARAGQSWHLMPVFGSILAVHVPRRAVPRLPRCGDRADRRGDRAGLGETVSAAHRHRDHQPNSAGTIARTVTPQMTNGSSGCTAR